MARNEIDAERTAAVMAAMLTSVHKDAQKGVEYALEAFRKMAEELKSRDFTNVKVEALGRNLAYVVKAVDEMYRLIQFADGKPDSRPDMGLSGLLQFLTPEQFEQVALWVKHGQQKEIALPPGQYDA